MTDSDITKPRVSWDIFFRGQDGYGEHMKVDAEDSAPIIKGRTQLLEWLKSIGAKPLIRDTDFKAPIKPAADPMLSAAQQVLGAAVTRNCAIHGTPMKRVPAGVSSRTGRAYNAFWACDAAPGCKGE